MLFNSYAFIFVFLPAVLIAFHAGRRFSRRVALGAVSILSLVFYALWDPRYLALLVPSLVINYFLGEIVDRTRSRGWLIAGVAANLAVIGWFKYSAFFYVTATGSQPPDFMRGIVLPLGISFITFQKIAYLVDIWRGHPKATSFDRFAFFVLFFPQLIAGPIVLFRHIDRQIRRVRHTNALFRASFQLGLTLFAIGLFKKVVIADSMAPFADAVFEFAERPGYDIGMADAWVGALAYSLQLYFDFSGYSDMAIGLARMFGFRLPVNFNSPYKATSIIDFWRRWHMTLSAFFREYVYIPLGGNRKGPAMQAGFVLIVFFLTGLWHGAGWTFIVWGSIHGVLVLTNHLWLKLAPWRIPTAISWPATFVAAVALWVVFRATSLASAVKIVTAMSGLGVLTGGRAFPDLNLYPAAYVLIGLICVICWTFPNSTQLVHRLRHGHLRAASKERPHPGRWWLPAAVTGIALYLAISSIGNVETKFIYFNF
jgi:D-alanyl-lipoteichoic acid acyltransferase DltB (MBOAT superfamily)